MRFDVNVSVRPAGSDELRTRTELKNMNSFNFAAKGIERRSPARSGSTRRAARSSRRRCTSTRATRTRRRSARKEEAQDYRYFPEPDLVPCSRRPSSSSGSAARSASCRARGSGGSPTTLSFYDADVLVTGGLDRLWSAVVDAGADPKEAANVLANPFVAAGVDPAQVDAAELAKLVAARAEIPRAAFDEALAHAGDEGFSAEPYLAQKAVGDASASSTRSSTR